MQGHLGRSLKKLTMPSNGKRENTGLMLERYLKEPPCVQHRLVKPAHIVSMCSAPGSTDRAGQKLTQAFRVYGDGNAVPVLIVQLDALEKAASGTGYATRDTSVYWRVLYFKVVLGSSIEQKEKASLQAEGLTACCSSSRTTNKSGDVKLLIICKLRGTLRLGKCLR
jgi:hypothetical protein